MYSSLKPVLVPSVDCSCRFVRKKMETRSCQFFQYIPLFTSLHLLCCRHNVLDHISKNCITALRSLVTKAACLFSVSLCASQFTMGHCEQHEQCQCCRYNGCEKRGQKQTLTEIYSMFNMLYVGRYMQLQTVHIVLCKSVLLTRNRRDR